jgi:flagellar motor switch protein FliN
MSSPESETLNPEMVVDTVTTPSRETLVASRDMLLQQAESALNAVEQALREPKLSKFQWSELSVEAASQPSSAMDLGPAATQRMKIVLGRTYVSLEEFRRWRVGEVVVLDRMVQEPVDILVNDRLVARGEVLVLDQKFCVRVTEILVSKKPRLES